MHSAKEDAASVALERVTLERVTLPQVQHQYRVTWASETDGGGSNTNFRSSSSWSDSIASSTLSNLSSKSQGPQRTRRAYPSSNVDTFVKTQMEVGDSPRKWVHWCVDATKTRLHEICVEAQIGAKRGSEFINELVSSYRRLRGVRWWFSLVDCATVKVVKVSSNKLQSRY